VDWPALLLEQGVLLGASRNEGFKSSSLPITTVRRQSEAARAARARVLSSATTLRLALQVERQLLAVLRGFLELVLVVGDVIACQSDVEHGVVAEHQIVRAARGVTSLL